MPALSQGLNERLDFAGTPDIAVEDIVRDVVLLEEAKAVLPALKAVAEHRAGEEGVRAVVGRRFALYPQTERNEAEWSAWWADYFDVLSDVPLSCLEAAMRVWIARPGAQFMPKPGELRDLAFRTPSKTLQRYQRAKRAVQMAADPHAMRMLSTDVPPDDGSESSVTEVHRMLAEFKAAVAGRQKPVIPAPRASTAGKPDERGLTKEMREWLARKAG